MELVKLQCKKCGHGWIPRVENPLKCPKCGHIIGSRIYLIKAKGEPAKQDAIIDFSKLFWEKKQGEKGEYEQTSARANQNCDLWKTLKAKLKEHKGFWQNGGFKFWFQMQDETVIDRRKA